MQLYKLNCSLKRLLLESNISKLNACVILVQNKSRAAPLSLFSELLTEKGHEAEGITEISFL